VCTFSASCFQTNGLIYLIGGTLLGMGVHPVAGHFVAEHYILHPGYETMSYYGPLNWVAFNVGYHNEHHDFPNIPGSRCVACCPLPFTFNTFPTTAPDVFCSAVYSIMNDLTSPAFLLSLFSGHHFLCAWCVHHSRYRLHLVRKYAPEFYEQIPQYDSWSKVIFDYITRADVTPFSRVKRTTLSAKKRAEIQARELIAHRNS
jgi:hypothetical protein